MKPIHQLPPERWLRQRPWGRDLRHLIRREYDRLPAKMQKYLSLKEGKIKVSHPDLQTALETEPLEMLLMLHLKEIEALQWRHEKAMGTSLRDWLKSGSQSFGFTSALTEELHHTDVEEILCEEISLPYEAFYIAFDDPADVAEDHHGFLISQRIEDGERTILINPMGSTVPDIDSPGHFEPAFPIPLTPGTRLLDQLEEAVRADLDAISDKEATRRRLAHEEERIVNIVLDVATYRAQQYRAIRQSIGLLANGLLYIDQCRSEIVTGWQPGIPDEERSRVETGRPGARKAEQRLRAQGWTTIHVCDIPERDTRSLEGSGERTITAHWRRGHWRRQHHGPNNQMVKRIRIRPTRVSGQPGDHARRYRVASDQSTPSSST